MKVEFYTREKDMLEVKNRLIKTFPKLTSIVFDCKKQDEDKWISVKDRQPKGKKPVLVYTKSTAGSGDNTTTAICDQGFWFLKGYEDSYCFPIHQRIVTHWQPLPEPPKENE